MSTRTLGSGAIFILGIAGLLFAVTHNNGIPDADQKNKEESVVRIEWNTLNHDYTTPKLQPWIWYQLGDGGKSDSKPIMKPGVDSITETIRKGRHIVAWVAVDQLHTKSNAVHTVKIFVNGEQKCGPGFNDQGSTQGGHNAICEAIS